MNFDGFYKRFTAFGLAFALSLFAAGFLYGINFSDIFKSEPKPAPKTVVATSVDGGASGGPGHARSEGGGISETRRGASSRRRSGNSETNNKPPTAPQGLTEGVKILSKPRANYTNEARANSVQGKVVLRVTFGANGTINAISVINGLPDGLTEVAIEAAKNIKFEPAKRGNVPYSVTKPVEYTFTIY